MKKPFIAVFGLLLFPDFSEVAAGRADPPWVNHDKVDFDQLLTLLRDLFPYGPALRLRVPNDTIDQVTLHVRSGMQIPGISNRPQKGSLECEDFGEALIKEARKQDGDIIQARAAWASHHALPNRAASPPPSLLPFVVETADFEDAILWMSGARVPLGLKPLQHYLTTADSEAPMEGRLPPSAQAQLGTLFGCTFEPLTVLTRLAVSSTPPIYRHL